MWYERRRRHPSSATSGAQGSLLDSAHAPSVFSRLSAISGSRERDRRGRECCWVHVSSWRPCRYLPATCGLRQPPDGRPTASRRGTLAAQAGGIAIAPADDFNYVTGHVERRLPLPPNGGEGDTLPRAGLPSMGLRAAPRPHGTAMYGASCSAWRAAGLDHRERQAMAVSCARHPRRAAA
jgi:hypothetical protein